MSPAFTHVEQSRNTLYFAARAKEVTNNAQVNMLVSDKQLVKHLQKEVARLEAELRTPEPTKTTDAMLREKELQIKKMETEMEELKRQRDLAQSQLQALHRTLDLNNNPKTPTARCLSFSIPTRNPTRQSATDPITLVSEIRKLEHLQLQLGEEATRALEVLQKKAGSEEAALAIAKLESEIKTMRAAGRPSDDDAQKISAVGSKANLKEEITRLHSQESAIATLEEKLENVQRSLDKMLESIPEMESRKRTKKKGKKTILPLPLSGSSSANVQSLLLSPCSPMAEDETENRTPDDGTPPGRQRRTSSVNMRKMQRLFQNAAEENIRSIKAYVTELKERVAKLQYQKQLLVCQVLELEANEGEYEQSGVEMVCSPEAWSSVFKEQRRQILRLWDVCHVSIVHRTQFYQLFRGDPDDQIYMEVELRRLTWLRHHFLEACNRSPAPTGDEPQNLASLASSARALRQERELLAKRMITRMTAEERAGMYQRWAVAMDSKQRRMQVANKLWTDPADAENVEESAHLVARLVGLGEGGEPVPKEMFELNLALPEARRPWLLIWNPIQNLLRA